jgi:hypothetical protein
MDAGLVIRPSATDSRSVARSSSGSLRGAVRPDLGAAQSVTAASNPDNVHHDPAQLAQHNSDPHGAQDHHTGTVILDAQSREVMFRAADVRARGLVRQVPETAARRLKAYARTAQGNTEETGVLADTEL